LRAFLVRRVFFLFFCFSLGMMLLPPVADSLVGLLAQASDGQRLI